MRKYMLTFTGTQPLIMHHDDIDWADRMEAWKLDKGNKKGSKAGDDRSPAFRWIGGLYHDGERVVVPTANVMKCAMEGASLVLVPGGKSGKTFKAQSQSGILPTSVAWPLLVNGKQIPFAPIAKLIDEKDFNRHVEEVAKMGFSLFKKRARIGQSKHVRVRPMFDNWSISGEIVVHDEQITHAVLTDIFQDAGRFKGLCDWRPSSKTPGFYGTFTASVKAV